MLELMVALNAERTPELFRRRLLRAGELIPGENVVVGELSEDGRTLSLVASDPALEAPEVAEKVGAMRMQHPVLARWAPAGDTSPHAISQFVEREQWVATELFTRLFARFGILDQLVIPIPLRDTLMAVAIGRTRWGFTAEEHEVAGRLQEILLLAVEQQHRDEIARATEPLLSGMVSEHGSEVLLCDRCGHVIRADGTCATVDPLVLATVRQAASHALQAERSPGSVVVDVSLNGSEGDPTRVRVFSPPPGDNLVSAVVTCPRARVVRTGLERHRLTPRQTETMLLVLRGARNAEIARELAISERTVEKHVRAAYEKLGARNRLEALLVILG